MKNLLSLEYGYHYPSDLEACHLNVPVPRFIPVFVVIAFTLNTWSC